MLDQNFGHKELYEVVIRAKVPMQFGNRYVEAEEPILYFDNVQMAFLTEQNRPIFARGGWGNMPRVIWEERSEVQFQMVEGVMSSVGMGILLSSNILSEQDKQPLYIHMKEGPLSPMGTTIINNKRFPYIETKYIPINYPQKKIFIFEYARDNIQQKIYGQYVNSELNENVPSRIALSLDKSFETPAKNSREYVIDYYYKYEDNALIYSAQKERFNGLFTLEAKFYSQDENEGHRYTNILYMPKVRIVSNIDLQLGERANPTVSTFNIIGLPETVGEQKNLIMEITRLDKNIDAEI